MRFTFRDLNYLTDGLSDLNFIAKTAAVTEKIWNKAYLLDMAMDGNIQPYAYDSIHMLASDGMLYYIDWMLVEAAMEGLITLLATLWQDNYSLVANLLSLMQHQTRE